MKTHALLLLAALTTTAIAAEPPSAVPEPAGYRMQDYRAPVPATLAGATVLDTARARALWADHGAVFIDAFPRPPKPANLPPDTIWVEPPHDDIPGSLWLPDTGYGRLPPLMDRYLQDNLREATGGDPARPLVIYCKANCWHSWNLAKRVVALGYSHVAWYPEGVEGWRAAGLPLEPAQARPRPAE